jgi:hypothetical protein
MRFMTVTIGRTAAARKSLRGRLTAVAASARLRLLCVLLSLTATVACRGSSNDLPVTPSVGTIATLQGLVIRADNYVPLAGVVVSIDGVSLTTRSDGTYAISGLRPGDALLSAERPGFRPFSMHVSLDGARTVNIFLVPL